MRKSHIAMFTVLGLIVVAMIVQAGVTRFVLSSIGADRDDAAAGSAPTAAQPTRRIDLRGFDALRIQGYWAELTITSGTDWSVDLSYPEAMADNVTAELHDGELRLNYRRSGFRLFNFGNRGDVRATIVMPELARVQVDGASSLTLSGFEGERLQLAAAGAHSIEGFDSRYDSLDLSLSGAGEAKLRGVSVTDAHVTLAGATDVTLTMNGGLLSGSIAGAGQITYHGTIREQQVTTAGATSVERAE